MEGRDTEINCVGVGHPPPTVQWRKISGGCSNRISTSMSNQTNQWNVTRVTAVLKVTGAYREDTGEYECTVNNQQRHITDNVSLIVQCM